MAKNTYELLLILDSNHYARDPGGISTRISEIVSEAGGEVLVNRLWMEQKLAYPIDKHQKGTYWLTYFEMEGVGISANGPSPASLRTGDPSHDGQARAETCRADRCQREGRVGPGFHANRFQRRE